jgi:DNA-binding transcriptional LysR family regulator
MGELPDDATLAARRLAVFAIGLYAAPAYLKRKGEPREPSDLMAHEALRLLMRSGQPAPWVLTCGSERWEGVPPGRITANAPDLLMRLARVGTGIVAVGQHFAEPYVASGELVPVLEEWSQPPATAWAVFTGRRLMPARTRAFLDAMQAEFAGPRCQAAAAQIEQGRRARRAAKVKAAA